MSAWLYRGLLYWDSAYRGGLPKRRLLLPAPGWSSLQGLCAQRSYAQRQGSALSVRRRTSEGCISWHKVSIYSLSCQALFTPGRKSDGGLDEWALILVLFAYQFFG